MRSRDSVAQDDDDFVVIFWKLLGKDCNAVENPSSTEQTGCPKVRNDF